MSEAESKLAGELLKMAADKFCEHGCNDFDLTEAIGGDIVTAVSLAKKFHAWHLGIDVSELVIAEGGGHVWKADLLNIPDYQLMLFAAHLLTGEDVIP